MEGGVEGGFYRRNVVAGSQFLFAFLSVMMLFLEGDTFGSAPALGFQPCNVLEGATFRVSSWGFWALAC